MRRFFILLAVIAAFFTNNQAQEHTKFVDPFIGSGGH
jgi:hypothetical protein